MANKPEYMQFLLDWMSPLGRLDSRRMFGGDVIYADGRTFALVARNTLYLKTDDVTRPQFEALGLKPFQPFPDKPGVMQYYPPPPEFFEDLDVMREWGRAAIGCALRAAPAKKRAARKK